MRAATRLRPSAFLVILAALPAGLAVAEAAEKAGAALAVSPPVVCTGGEVIRLQSRRIDATGDAIDASGRCKVYVVGSRIEARGVAVRATNRAEVHLVSSRIVGHGASLYVDNRALISFDGSEIFGPMVSYAYGRLVDQGGNRIDKSAASAGPGQPGAGAGESVRVGPIEVDSGGVRVGGGTVVDIDERGINVGGGAVVLDEEGISVGGGQASGRSPGGAAGGETVVIDERGGVTVIDGDEVVIVDESGNVRVDSPTGTILVSGDWRTGGTVYRDTDRVLVELGARSEDDRIYVDLAGDVLFDFDSSAIRAEAAVTLSKIAHVIRRRAVGRVMIVGHTDSIGSPEYNQELSQKRARAVVGWLNRAEGIPLELMASRGAGSSQPIAHNTMPNGDDNPAGRARNRRVEIQIQTGG